MHAVVRTFSGAGAKQLFDLIEQRKAEVEAAIRSVPGLVSYTMARTGDGGITVTVCQDKAGTDESMRIAREWIQKNASGIGANPPAVSEGSVLIQIK
jgi:restriction endonuclease Mrr